MTPTCPECGHTARFWHDLPTGRWFCPTCKRRFDTEEPAA